MFATLGVLAVLRWRRAPVLSTADVLAPSVLLGEAITRVGCFLNGCCYGTATSLPWAVRFPEGSAPANVLAGLAVHPAQLYASVLALAGFLVLSRMLRRPPFPGAVLAALAVWIGAQRILLDLVRHHEVQVVLATPAGIPVTTNQAISAALLFAGAAALAAGARRSRQPDAA